MYSVFVQGRDAILVTTGGTETTTPTVDPAHACAGVHRVTATTVVMRRATVAVEDGHLGRRELLVERPLVLVWLNEEG